jgi:hypothetical protein
VKSHDSNQRNKNATIRTAAKAVEETNQINESSDTKNEDIEHTQTTYILSEKDTLEKIWKQKLKVKS